MKMTSAYANKMLKQFNDEKEFWNNKERQSCVYTAAVGETPVVPSYDFIKVSETIKALDEKICKIKHAINLANVTNEVQVGERSLSIDSVLVEMAQLNKRKEFLDYLRKQEPKMRKEAGFAARNSAPEYQYINYDLEVVKKEYEAVAACIMEMQLALDCYNQTVEFDVEL